MLVAAAAAQLAQVELAGRVAAAMAVPVMLLAIAEQPIPAAAAAVQPMPHRMAALAGLAL